MEELKLPDSVFLQGDGRSSVLKMLKTTKTRKTKTPVSQIFQNTDHWTCQPSEFRGRSWTDFLNDPRLCHNNNNHHHRNKVGWIVDDTHLWLAARGQIGQNAIMWVECGSQNQCHIACRPQLTLLKTFSRAAFPLIFILLLLLKVNIFHVNQRSRTWLRWCTHTHPFPFHYISCVEALLAFLAFGYKNEESELTMREFICFSQYWLPTQVCLTTWQLHPRCLLPRSFFTAM